jgi:hypothetical protein
LEVSKDPLGAVILRSPSFLLADDEGSLQLLDLTTPGILRFALDRPVQGFAQNDSLIVFCRAWWEDLHV